MSKEIINTNEESSQSIEKPKNNFEWEEYKQLIDLFKFYLDLVIKTITATAAISGGIIAYVLKNDSCEKNFTCFGILLPVFICFGIGLGFLQAIPSTKDLTKALTNLKASLHLELAPHTHNLTKTLRWSGIILIISSFSSLGLFLYLLLKT